MCLCIRECKRLFPSFFLGFSPGFIFLGRFCLFCFCLKRVWVSTQCFLSQLFTSFQYYTACGSTRLQSQQTRGAGRICRSPPREQQQLWVPAQWSKFARKLWQKCSCSSISLLGSLFSDTVDPKPREKPCSAHGGVHAGKARVSAALKPSLCEHSACIPKRQRWGMEPSPWAFGSRVPPLPPPLPHIYPLWPHTSLADRSYLKALAGCATNGRAPSRLPPSPWSPCADVGARHGLL